MPSWSAEIKELENIHGSLKSNLTDVEKELARLIKADDENIVLLYSRRCLEVIITDLCKCELKRPRKTEPLKGIIDKLNKEEKVPPHIIASMHGLNTLSTFGAHPNEYDPEQVKPVLNNLTTILKWYLKYKNLQTDADAKPEELSEKRKPQISFAEKSIIVLPFENMSPDPDQEYFSDGLTEEIITDLSHIHDLLVISRSSAMTFKGTKSTIKEIAGKVNVRYVLEGSVRKAGNNLRITAQLIDSISDTHIWAEKYTGTLDDIFDVQEQVSKCIAKALQIELNSSERKKISERPIDNVFAYDCYKKAYSEIISMSPERLERGLSLLHKGLDMTGPNPLIYSGMAFAYWQFVNLGFNHETNIKKAEEFALKALELDPESAEAHSVIGLITVFREDMLKAIYHLVQAHKSKPEDPEIMGWLVMGFSGIGKSDKGKALLEKCYKIDPLNPWNDAVSGWNLFFGGEFNLALNQAFAIYNLTPESGMNQFLKSLVLVYNDREEEAYEFLCKFVTEPAKDMWTQLAVFLKYVIKKDKTKLSSLLSPDFVKSIQIDPQNLYHMASFYSYLDEKEEALDYLEKAIGKGFVNYPFISSHDKLLTNIRGEERFKRLMERSRIAWENFEV